jgi:hypothetical protein
MSKELEEQESELVNEILQKFEEIGIDTSEWEYKFGDGNFAAEFIQAGIKDHLEKLEAAATPATGQGMKEDLWRVGNRLRVTTIYDLTYSENGQDKNEGKQVYEGVVEEYKKGLRLVTDSGKFNTQGSYWFGNILDQNVELINADQSPQPDREPILLQALEQIVRMPTGEDQDAGEMKEVAEEAIKEYNKSKS